MYLKLKKHVNNHSQIKKIIINRCGYKIHHASLLAAAVQGGGCGFHKKKIQFVSYHKDHY